MTGALREANGGGKVDVVLEMVGGRTFERSLKALAPFGRLVHFGQAAREGVPKVDPGQLMGRSQGVLGFWLVHMMQRPDLMGEAMSGMFEMVRSGELEVVGGGEYPLEEARRAHEDLRSRTTVGKLILVP
jgi:NADPH2:quinone reductase